MRTPPWAISDHPAEGGVIRLGVRGEVDLATAPDLERAVAGAVARPGAREVLVDLSAVTFLDASGIAALARSHLLAAESGVRLRVCGARGVVRRVLAIAGLAAWLSPP
ncbi:anti-sigma factor antagonist [Actinoplanes sp. NBRC 14428]|nr:anti-sigma factor antagonist [Actinoplanes sp. NBRC 14428]